MGYRYSIGFPTSYSQCAEIWARSRAARLHGRVAFQGVRATRMQKDDDRDGFQIIYHTTPVVTFLADGRVILRDGGWKTVTTKARMNACGMRVGTGAGGRWWVGDDIYVDGVIVDRHSCPVGVTGYGGKVLDYAYEVRHIAASIISSRQFRHLKEPMKWKLLLYGFQDGPRSLVA